MNFYLNGIEKSFTGDPELPLLKYIRDVEEITSVKDGCSPQASCGSCTVQVDGKATLSCVTPMKKVEGKHVVTPDGLDEYRKRVFTNAFVSKSGVQCGFCIPGIVMQANALLEKNPHPTRKEIANALQPNLCRCTGYVKIIDSIEYAAEAFRETKEIPSPVQSETRIGKPYPKYNADKLVLGLSPFVADVKIDGMVHAALKFSDHPRAKVISIEIEDASLLKGVLKIFTAKDIPGVRKTGLIVQDWDVMIDEGETTRYVGDVLAVAVAETEDIARKAAELIKVKYEVLEPLIDPFEAVKEDAPKIHENGNILSTTIVDRGNVEKAFRDSAYISKGKYTTQMIEHGFLEPECAVAKPDGVDGVEILSQGQGVYEDRRAIAKMIGLPEEKVRVILVPNGGGFGGKEDLSVQHHAALCAFILQKPVRLALTRDESILMHPKRHPLFMEYEVGCDKDGKFTALKADIIGDTGAYASVGMKVLERAAGHATGAYHIPNAYIKSRAVYTNNLPCGAMRGFGANQVTFAIENCVDDLCEQGKFDRWQFRFNNALVDGGTTSTGQILKGGAGVRETLLAVKDVFQNAKYAGIACGIKNTGLGNGMPDDGIIKIEIVNENHVILNHGWTEMGQGVNTMAVQFLCNETGIDPNIIEVKVDTKSNAYSGMTTASRATSIIGNSIINTAKNFSEDLKTKTLKELTGKVYEGSWTCDWTTKPGKASGEIITHYSYSYATQVVLLNDEGNIEKIIAAHDAGKIINPNLFEGQIQGSVHMGLGYAISEELEMENGRPKTTRFRKMGILRAKEMPEVEVIGIEVADPIGPYGAKGVGEIGLVPTAGAVANAFYQFDGTRYYKLPIKNRVRK
ncbi:MAG: selenium-dependent xanthine dehydrogenase [Ignavibacteriaceae bacterium]|nr:selenium-dependent xanthine dehydrogenase [Ignavibacteriaceae bacterium]